MTPPTLRSILREACERWAKDVITDAIFRQEPNEDELDTIATDAEAAIRALLVSDAAVEAALHAWLQTMPIYNPADRGEWSRQRLLAMRAALTAATGATP